MRSRERTLRRFVARAAKSDLLGNVFVICGDKRPERERSPHNETHGQWGLWLYLCTHSWPSSGLEPRAFWQSSNILYNTAMSRASLISVFKPKRNNRFVRSDTLENGPTSFKLNMSSRLSGREDSTGLITSPLSSSAGIFVESLRTLLQHLYSNTAVTAMVGLKQFFSELVDWALPRKNQENDIDRT